MVPLWALVMVTGSCQLATGAEAASPGCGCRVTLVYCQEPFNMPRLVLMLGVVYPVLDLCLRVMGKWIGYRMKANKLKLNLNKTTVLQF